MSNIKNHEQILLGNAVDTILNYTAYIPSISEYQFERDVVVLLQNPFDKANLERYQPYVRELTRPLNVVANDNQEQVLFQVPALMMSPRATIASNGGMTAENFFSSLKREYELGGKQVNAKIANFMNKITVIPDMQTEVIQPLRAILQRYGRDFEVPGLANPHQAAASAPGGGAVTGQSFSDDYED